MKKLNLSVMAMLLLGAVACQKNYGTRPLINGNVSNQEAASMVANSLSVSSNGVANIAADVTFNAASLISTHQACGTTRADTISRRSAAGASVTYNYNLTYNNTLICDTAKTPDSLSSSLIYSGSYNGPNESSTNSGSSIFTVSGLASSAADYVINGEYKQAGSFKSKTDTTNAGNNSIDMVIKTLTLKKPQRSIISGTATISVTGDVPKKGAFNYNGTVVFNSNNIATLTLNGTVYTINLATGRY